LQLFQEVVAVTPELQTSTDNANRINSIYMFCTDIRTNSHHLPVEHGFPNCASRIARDPWTVPGGSVDLLLLRL